MPFRKCGFEFTAEKRSDFKYPTITIKTKEWRRERSHYIHGFGFSSTGKWVKVDKEIDLNDYDAFDIFEYQQKQAPKWIQRNGQNDSCLECPTPIVRNRAEVVSYFIEFEKWTKKIGLTLNLDNATEALGGCHIHISLAGLGKHKELFYSNIINFVTNYPELNWAFNDPNDVENANSLLGLAEPRSMRSVALRISSNSAERRRLRILARAERRSSRQELARSILYAAGDETIIRGRPRNFKHENVTDSSEYATPDMPIADRPISQNLPIENNYDEEVQDSSYDMSGEFRESSPDESEIDETEDGDEMIQTNRYEMAIISPRSTSKTGAINFNFDYNTIEFRVFDQPINLTEHLLHVEVAQRIFHYCLQKAKKKKAIALNITPDFFENPDRKKSNERLNECMKAIKIDVSRCSRQIENLNQRFTWHKKDTSYGYLQ